METKFLLFLKKVVVLWALAQIPWMVSIALVAPELFVFLKKDMGAVMWVTFIASVVIALCDSIRKQP